MKYIFSIALLAATVLMNAQVIIGDFVGTAPASQKESVLLEFAAGQNKGLIVPYLRTLPDSPAPGTIMLDATTPATVRVAYYNNTEWVDLSGQDADITDYMSIQPTAIVESGKITIGDEPSQLDGVLVLESSTKAMILPIVSDVQNIVNPSPGMLVYVNKAGAKRLAVFNGTKWSFWQANN